MTRTTVRKGNMGQRSFKKHFKFYNFSEIFYCRMNRLRNTNLSVFIQFQYTKIWGRVCLRNIQNFKISMKYFTVAWPDSETRVWMFLYNVSTQELFQERKIWDWICLRNLQNFWCSIRFFTVTWPKVAQTIGSF